jgi:glycine/D-amino acid oxidase-like deaminating enzyme
MPDKEKKQILIVGQGLAGTMLSYQLFKKNIAHKVIDNPVAGSASRAAAGLINPIVVKRVNRTWQADVFQPYAHQIYQELEEFLSERFYYPLTVRKIYGKDDEAFWHHRYQKETLKHYISFTAKHDLPDGIRQPYGYGTIHPCARLDMASILKSYRQFLQRNNALLEVSFNDQDLKINQNGLEWQGNKASKVIFCRGSFDANSPFFKHLKWNNTKGELLDVTIPGLKLEYILSKGVFVMPIGDHQYKIGATYSHSWKSLEPSPEKQTELLNKWSNISDLPLSINRQLTGIRPTFADRRPSYGFLDEHPQIGMFNGLGSRGGLMAPYLANAFANLIDHSQS